MLYPSSTIMFCGPGTMVCGPGTMVCGPGTMVCGPGTMVCGPGSPWSMAAHGASFNSARSTSVIYFGKAAIAHPLDRVIYLVEEKFGGWSPVFLGMLAS
ncbi:hypothetical protein B0T17DRAFT_546870 [Bombardia bombarda]|uniref:Uncharacterized protein n=1 Tax=Bombardia bombarda TaxID=252184 RepID=A0AA39WC65_9PEZI|nr:hypothetical protein B0T17DRAFT_546870 [Bombardia bombarda]